MEPTLLNSIPTSAWPLALSVSQIKNLTGLSRGSIITLLEEGTLERVRFGTLRTHRASRRSVMRLLGLDEQGSAA